MNLEAPLGIILELPTGNISDFSANYCGRAYGNSQGISWKKKNVPEVPSKHVLKTLFFNHPGIHLNIKKFFRKFSRSFLANSFESTSRKFAQHFLEILLFPDVSLSTLPEVPPGHLLEESSRILSKHLTRFFFKRNFWEKNGRSFHMKFWIFLQNLLWDFFLII